MPEREGGFTERLSAPEQSKAHDRDRPEGMPRAGRTNGRAVGLLRRSCPAHTALLANTVIRVGPTRDPPTTSAPPGHPTRQNDRTVYNHHALRYNQIDSTLGGVTMHPEPSVRNVGELRDLLRQAELATPGRGGTAEFIKSLRTIHASRRSCPASRGSLLPTSGPSAPGCRRSRVPFAPTPHWW